MSVVKTETSNNGIKNLKRTLARPLEGTDERCKADIGGWLGIYIASAHGRTLLLGLHRCRQPMNTASFITRSSSYAEVPKCRVSTLSILFHSPGENSVFWDAILSERVRGSLLQWLPTIVGCHCVLRHCQYGDQASPSATAI